MLIRLLCVHEMTKYVCKILHLNSKRLLRKLPKILGGYFILPHPVYAAESTYQTPYSGRSFTVPPVISFYINSRNHRHLSV